MAGEDLCQAAHDRALSRVLLTRRHIEQLFQLGRYFVTDQPGSPQEQRWYVHGLSLPQRCG